MLLIIFIAIVAFGLALGHFMQKDNGESQMNDGFTNPKAGGIK